MYNVHKLQFMPCHCFTYDFAAYGTKLEGGGPWFRDRATDSGLVRLGTNDVVGKHRQPHPFNVCTVLMWF